MERPTDELPCSGLGSPSSHHKFPNPLITDITLNKKHCYSSVHLCQGIPVSQRFQNRKLCLPPSTLIKGSINDSKTHSPRWSNITLSAGVWTWTIAHMLCKYKYVNLHKGIKDLNSRSSFMTKGWKIRIPYWEYCTCFWNLIYFCSQIPFITPRLAIESLNGQSVLTSYSEIGSGPGKVLFLALF